MEENEIEKLPLEILDQEDIDQLEFSFILDREETNSPFPYLMSAIEIDQSTLHQKDFLMRNSLKIKDKKD